MPADRIKWTDDHEHQTTLPDDGCDDPICYWWEDMRPREVRELVHEVYERARRGRRELIDAVAYTLRRIGTDPDFAYYCAGTETLLRLCTAYAAVTGQDVEDLVEEVLKDRQPEHRRRESEVVEFRREMYVLALRRRLAEVEK